MRTIVQQEVELRRGREEEEEEEEEGKEEEEEISAPADSSSNSETQRNRPVAVLGFWEVYEDADGLAGTARGACLLPTVGLQWGEGRLSFLAEGGGGGGFSR